CVRHQFQILSDVINLEESSLRSYPIGDDFWLFQTTFSFGVRVIKIRRLGILEFVVALCLLLSFFFFLLPSLRQIRLVSPRVAGVWGDLKLGLCSVFGVSVC